MGSTPLPRQDGYPVVGLPGAVYGAIGHTLRFEPPMKLETSVELLERVRAAEKVSWWKLPRVLDASESTVKNWKRGRTTIDRKFAMKIAEILNESPEYVIACIEGERETHADVLKVWERIAAKFRSKVASVLLAGALVLGVGNAGKAEASALYPARGSDAAMYIMLNVRREVQDGPES